MSASPRAGCTALRLSPGFRIGLYAAFAALFASGAGWLIADWLKNGSGDDVWQESAAYLLMLHGGSAMAILMLLGALAPLHVQRAWRSRRNRATGHALSLRGRRMGRALAPVDAGYAHDHARYLRRVSSRYPPYHQQHNHDQRQAWS